MKSLAPVLLCATALAISSAQAATPVVPTPLHTFTTQREDVTHLVFSPDGKTLASGGENCRLQFWDLKTGKQKRGLSRQIDSLYNIHYSPDGKLIATGTSQFVGVQLWDAQTGQLLRTLKEPYPASKGQHVFSFEFAPDGRSLFACSYPTVIQQWDIKSGKMLRAFKGVGKQYDFAISPNGKTLVSASPLHTGDDNHIDKTIGHVWDIKSGKVVRSVPGIGWPITFSPNGSQLFTRLVDNGNDSKWGQWSLPSGKLVRRSPQRLTANGGATPLAISPNGRLMATGHQNKTVLIADARTHKLLQLLPAGNAMILAVAFSPDGSILATSDWNSRIRLWRVKS